MYAVKPAGTRERAREFTSKPAHFGTAKRRRIERLSYRGIQGKGSEVLHLPVPSPLVAPSLRPCIPRVLSSPFRCPPVHSVSLISPSRFATRVRFLSLLSAFRPQIVPRSPHRRYSTADTERAYACVHVVTTYYALLLTLAYYYEQWRIDDLPSQPSPPRATARFLPGNFRESRKGDAYSPRRHDLCTLFPSSFLEKLPLQCAPNLDGELLRIYFIY